MTSRTATYAAFLAADPRRQGDALELGHDWLDCSRRWRVCWYQQTGELTAEAVDDLAALDVNDFHAGISGPVDVLAVISSREQLERRLGQWPTVEHARPHTLARLRELLAS